MVNQERCSSARDKQEFAPDHPDTLETKNDLAVLYKEQGRYEEAEPLLIEAVEGRRFKLGEWRAKLAQIEDFEE